MTPSAPPRPPARWPIFAIVAVALFMASVDGTIVATALPTLQRALHTSISGVGWTLTAYTLGQIIAAPLAGRLGDQYGRKRVFLIALAIFTASSLLCGLTSSIFELIPLRIVQALGGGAFLPSAIGVVADTFEKDRRRAVGLTSSIIPTGGLLGPVLGGILIHAWSWRWVFFINVPIGIVLIVVAARVIPAGRRRHSDQRPDLLGVALLTVLMLSFMAAMTVVADHGLPLWPLVLAGFVAVFVASAAGIARRSRRVAHPLIPLALVTGPGFRTMNVINLVYGSCVLGLATLLPLYAQLRYDLSVLESGLLLTARALGSIVIATVAALVLDRTGYRLPIMAGLGLIAAGFGLVAVPPPFGLPVMAWLAVSTALTGLGFGLGAPATNNASLSMAPDSVGVVTGLRAVVRQSGAIFAVSVATAVTTGSSGLALAIVFGVTAVLVVATLPLVLRVPEDAREGDKPRARPVVDPAPDGPASGDAPRAATGDAPTSPSAR